MSRPPEPKSEKMIRLEVALEGLRRSEIDGPEGILPYAMCIPEIARTMMSFSRGKSRLDAAKLRTVRTINRLSSELSDKLQDVDLSNGYLRETQYWQRDHLLIELFELIRVSSLAEGECRTTIKTGAPKKERAKRIAAYAAANFELLTGREATVITPAAGGKAYGPFLDFLGEVFKILDVDAKPESQAKLASKQVRTHGAWEIREKSERGFD